ARYESEMAKARSAANAEREKLRADAVRKEQEILGAVRASAAQTLENGKKSALVEAERARATLKAQSGVLARDLAGRVLGREVQS
ncbi:MAG TPA: H(+)-transporting ATPase, partial [Elusimicrobiota bacterium]|nr:H(+)-transporting ATPase [Elusimicrobiota bacterium]